LYLDDEAVIQSDVSAWTQYVVTASGRSWATFIYMKDSSVSDLSDTVYIDDIMFVECITVSNFDDGTPGDWINSDSYDFGWFVSDGNAISGYGFESEDIDDN